MPKKPAPVLPVPVEYDDTEQIVVSFSELDTYRQCPLKHFLAYKQRWTKPPEEGSPLSKGSLWHAVMEAHYLVIKAEQDEWEAANGGRIPFSDTDKILARCWEAVRPHLFDEKGNQTDDQALIQWMYEGYVEKYGIDHGWRILAVEYKLAEYLPGFHAEDESYVLKGKLDLIVQDQLNGKVWVVDHKSGANLPGQFDLEIDDQFGVYTWLLQKQGLKVIGSIHNAARTTRNQADFPGYVGKSKPQTLEQRMSRTVLNRSNKELENLIRDAEAVAVNMYPPVDAELPLYSSPDPRQCGWKCDFKEIHLIARKGRSLPTVLQEYGFVQNYERH